MAKKKTSKTVAACVSCGVLMSGKEAVLVDGKYTCLKCSESGGPPAFTSPKGIWKAVIYLMSFLAPIVGFVIAGLFIPQKNEGNRKFGRTCLIISLAAVGLGIIFFIFILLIENAFGDILGTGVGIITESYY